MSEACITGYYVRVKVNDKWGNHDIASLTHDQINDLLKDAERERLIAWVSGLAEWIREHKP